MASTDSDTKHDLSSILFSPNRHYLLRNNGDQVKLDDLKGKIVGVYFSASWCGPCRGFTPTLVEAYQELLPLNKFEIIFVSRDRDNDSFVAYFSAMPWLAVPFSDSETRDELIGVFDGRRIPTLVILDEDGKVSTKDGRAVVEDFGAGGYPFSFQHLGKLREEQEEARRNQTLNSLLVNGSRDFGVMSDGKKVPVAELEGKMVGLYFHWSTFDRSRAFNPTLIEVYNSLKDEVANFEIVIVPLDDDEKESEHLPFLSLPIKDKQCQKLVRYFEINTLPTLVVVGPDGKTLHLNIADAIEEHGVSAYPFTPEKFAKLEEIENEKREAQTLESILVSGERDFILGKDDVKIPVSKLIGKTVLLYFSAHTSPPCQAFLPELIEAYQEIKRKDNPLEIIYISNDMRQDSFDESFSKMPWLALPYLDKRARSLHRYFKQPDIPVVVAIGPNGKTVTTEARELIGRHGAEAYPFTAERVQEIKEAFESAI